jgi:putative drug exporter of the RND superfamily
MCVPWARGWALEEGTSMPERLAKVVLGQRRLVLAVAGVLALLGAVASVSVFGKLTSGGWTDPASPSGRASAILSSTFRQGQPNLVLLVSTPHGAGAPGTVTAGTALARKLAAEPGITGAESYWTSGRPPQLRSRDGRQALIVATIAGDDNTVEKRFAQLMPRYQGTRDGLAVSVGGFAALQHELNVQGQKDAERGETVVLPVTLVALVLVFGSVVAASLPLVVAVVTMLLCLGAMWVLASFISLSSLSVSVVTLLGLGLAIDYSLLMVNRYREELRTGLPPEQAIEAAMATAGRTVVFSAAMVAVASSGMAWFPLDAIRSMAYAGIATALLAAVTSLTVMPALFAVLGPRIEKWRLLRRRPPATTAAATENGFWHRLATFVMRRPVPIALAVTAVLLLLGAPFLGIKLGMPNETVLPAASPARQVATAITTNFSAGQQNALQVVAPRVPADPRVAAGYAAALSRQRGVDFVATASGTYAHGVRAAPPSAANRQFAAGHSLYYSVVPAGGGVATAERLVGRIRAVPAPFGVLVAGIPAYDSDASAAVRHWLPYALAWVAVIMLVLLFLVTGSVLLPFLALVLSALSLTATFGALVWIFQDGHLSGLLGFTASGSIAVTVPVLLFALSFGLAMDYQVFLLARITEEYERTGDTRSAVALGLERVGRIVTAAAVLISLVFLAFTFSGISLEKAFGIGLPLAVLLDATLIRGALLPATMRLGRGATWWAPGPLRRVHGRVALRESARGMATVPAGDHD